MAPAPQLSLEGIEDQAELLEGDHSEQRHVTRFPEDDRGVSVTLREPDVAFRNVALDHRPVGQLEELSAFWLEFQLSPHLIG